MKKNIYSWSNLICFFIKGCLLFAVLLCIPFLLDMEYKGLLHICFTERLLSCVIRPFFRLIGITYKELEKFIVSNAGFIISLLGIFMTIASSYLNHSQEKIFGLEHNKVHNIVTRKWTYFQLFLRRGNLITPIFAIYFLLSKNYMSFFSLLVINYLLVLLQLKSLAETYDYDIKISSVVKYILSLGDPNDISQNLEILGKQISDNKEWDSANNIWKGIIQKLTKDEKKTNYDIYFYGRKYFEKVFCNNIENAEKTFFEFLDIFEQFKYGEKINYFLLRGIMDALLQSFDSKQMEEFLINITSRHTTQSPENTTKSIDDLIEIEYLWIAVHIIVKLNKGDNLDAVQPIHIIIEKTFIISLEDIITLLGDDYWVLNGMEVPEIELYRHARNELISVLSNEESKNEFLEKPRL